MCKRRRHAPPSAARRIGHSADQVERRCCPESITAPKKPCGTRTALRVARKSAERRIEPDAIREGAHASRRWFLECEMVVFKWDPNIGREGLDSIKP